MIDPVTFFLTLLSSLALCGIAIRWPSLFQRDHHLIAGLSARQAQHTRPTSRVGGGAVTLAFVIGLSLNAGILQDDLIGALVPGLLVFAIGLREDMMRDASIRLRLIIGLTASAASIWLSGVLVPGLGLAFADVAFGSVAVGIIVTLLWSAGTSNAVNLIDGLNGLAAIYALAALFGIWVVSGYTGDADIRLAAVTLMVALAPFLILNWPFGYIFMGDAGAYAIGYALGWLSILLLARNPEVSGFAMLLILFWPVGETVFSMMRRLLRRKAAGQADRLHFHHLVVRSLPKVLGKGLEKQLRNSIATFLMIPLFSLPIVVGVMFWDQPAQSAVILACATLLFIVTYRVLGRFVRKRYRAQEARQKALKTPAVVQTVRR